jgi:hypothetical protein
LLGLLENRVNVVALNMALDRVGAALISDPKRVS